ncbi:MAG: sodium/glutamate symporter [Phocaeicola sp.]
MMNDFTPWALFVDIGIISLLLLVGKVLRVKVKWIQQLFIPPSLLAGFIALALGGNGFELLPISNNVGTYAGILIALVFATLPFTSSQQRVKKGSETGPMWAYSQAALLLQWAFGGFLGLLLLNQFWPVGEAFGIVMPAGFSGGHGTAAAIGQAFGTQGKEDILTLAMTSATVGILSAVVMGLILIKWGAKKGYTSFLTNFEELPTELRTGVFPAEKRESMGDSTLSSISMDSSTFYFSLLCIAALGGYGASQSVNYFLPMLELPVFSCSFVVALIIKKILDHTRIDQLVCKCSMGHLSGTLTDYLVAFGIASIKISVVLTYIVPLTILLLCGFVGTLLYVFLVGRKMMSNSWFEKSIFTWGWTTGTVAMGIALLRVADPHMKSRCLDSYALAYLFIAPVEITIITLAPVAFLNGYGLLFSSICLAMGIGVLFTAYLKGWYRKG